MASNDFISRRKLLRTGLLGTVLLPLVGMHPESARAAAAEAPLLSPNDPAAEKVKYTEDASKAKGVPAGDTCANCALYEGTYNSKQGPCQIFPDKRVLAAGWCSSWAPQI
jgi:High potential iron-sulfur protein